MSCPFPPPKGTERSVGRTGLPMSAGGPRGRGRCSWSQQSISAEPKVLIHHPKSSVDRQTLGRSWLLGSGGRKGASERGTSGGSSYPLVLRSQSWMDTEINSHRPSRASSSPGNCKNVDAQAPVPGNQRYFVWGGVAGCTLEATQRILVCSQGGKSYTSQQAPEGEKPWLFHLSSLTHCT